MTLILPAVVLVFVGVATPALAQGEESAVPVDKAPYHLPVFANDYVAVLKIEIPPQGDTGYHSHKRGTTRIEMVEFELK